ncbi:hypothetical protein ABT246_16860 [Streptomyces sp. NPDC001553]|uniref:hypothetical protein n=1 Tax=Streptomyces sp. NPDC001553 TaxID=3154385 RepID=UPI0033250287
MAIGAATIGSAVFTYLSLYEESAAVDDDRRAQLETVDVRSRVVSADTRVRHESAMVGRYRQLNAEAGRLEAGALGAPDASRIRDEARLMRMVAEASSRATRAFEWSRLKQSGERAKYDYEGRLQDILQSSEYLNLPAGQPALTAAAADRHHAQSQRYALCIVATITVLALLTVARISSVRLRPWIAGLSMATGLVAIPVLAGWWT